MPVGGRFSEIDAERLQTRLLLDYGQDNLHEITLIREGAYEDDGAGGVVETGEAPELDPVKRYLQSVSGDPFYVLDDDGQRVQITHVLIGPLGDDIRARDTFTVNDRLLYVLYVDPEDRSQTKALCREISHPDLVGPDTGPEEE